MTTLDDALRRRRSVRDFTDAAIPADALARVLWAAQGATDESGNRTAPSAHALHPLRLFVTAARIEGLESGFYAVSPETGEMQQLHTRDIRADLQRAAIDDQAWIGESACILSICADFVTPCRDFADQMPFGQRGARYVYLEAGAAAQNALLQAAVDGLGGVLVAGFEDEATAAVLGLAAPIAPVLHLCLGKPQTDAP